jgi:lysozyme
MTTLSSTGEELIKRFEELRLVAYLDQRGRWTCGWGHTGADVVEGTTCTAEQAETWFQEDTLWAVKGCSDSLTTNISQPQFDALVSFTFNVGVGAEEHSTLIGLVNARNLAGAAAEFPKWDHVNGVVNAGLQRRRLAEQALFLS